MFYTVCFIISVVGIYSAFCMGYVRGQHDGREEAKKKFLEMI